MEKKKKKSKNGKQILVGPLNLAKRVKVGSRVRLLKRQGCGPGDSGPLGIFLIADFGFLSSNLRCVCLPQQV